MPLGHLHSTTLTSVGSPCPGRDPQLQVALPGLRVSQLDGAGAGVTLLPPFPGLPLYTPLESTSWAGRNHQRGPPPNGSTELTLDNEGLRRKGRETQGFRNLASRAPQTKMGSRLSLVWELGKKGSGGRMALSSSQQGSADFLRTKQSGERAPGEGRSHLLVPQLRMGEVEGGGLLLLLPWCPAPPGFFSLTGLEKGQGNSPSS